MTDDAKAVEIASSILKLEAEEGSYLHNIEVTYDVPTLAKAFLALREENARLMKDVTDVANQLQCLCQPINRICTKHRLLKALGSKADG